MNNDSTLRELYNRHEGKGSDKWSSYLDEYENRLGHQKNSIRSILEVGVQNGGSLEIWSRYFKNAEHIIGVDIDPKVGHLRYEDARVHALVGDASKKEIADQILSICPEGFDVIIDDGSHTSGDIIRSFSLLFDQVKIGGIYAAEDLHCSYWGHWGGGLNHPYSSVSFFKRLVDMVNHQHFGVPLSREKLLEPFSKHYGIEFKEAQLAKIQRIEFVNSICFIYKAEESAVRMEPRVIVGRDESVQSNQFVIGQPYIPPAQDANVWTVLTSPIEDAYSDLQTTKNDLLRVTEYQEQLSKSLEESVASLKRKDDALQENIRSLRAEKAKLQDVSRRGREKEIELQGAKQQLAAASQELHAAYLSRHEYITQTHAMSNSLSWRLTRPLRMVSGPVFRTQKIARKVIALLRRYSPSEVLTLSVTVWRKNGIGGVFEAIKNSNAESPLDHAAIVKPLEQLPRVDKTLVTRRIHIIAELSIPQCKKYRVDQKEDLLQLSGFEVSVSSWTDLVTSFAGLETASAVIFYRVPNLENFQILIEHCKKKGIPTYWEVDDLIFDEQVLSQTGAVKYLTDAVYQDLLRGTVLYKQAMLACDFGIASTNLLREQMLQHGVADVLTIENGLDPSTLATSEAILIARTPAQDGFVRIVYGSGTNTHNADFLEAAPSIVRVLETHENVRFRLIGPVTLPEQFDHVMDKVEIFRQCDFKEYLRKLAECDISIAPLEDVVFNYSKSNIKYIEASILGLSSVCSGLPNFSDVISNELDGFICRTSDEWTCAFDKLIASPALRVEMGERARENVLRRYSLDAIATNFSNETGAAAMPFKPRDKNRKRVLSVNCLYAPRSFGGATVVAEALNTRISEDPRFELLVLTTLSVRYGRPYDLIRYQHKNHICFGIVLPDYLTADDEVDNPLLEKIFEALLQELEPDLIHLHSIQGIGVGLPRAASRVNIPYVITAHDFWWILDRGLFILSKEDLTSGPAAEIVDPLKYIQDAKSTQNSTARSKNAVAQGASLILTPSDFSAEVYSGLGFKRVRVNKNGVPFPRKRPTRIKGGSDEIVFGYIDGNTEIKGFHLIKQVFSDLKLTNAKLLVVDNAINLGRNSFSEKDFVGIQNYEIRPGFNHEGIDEFFDTIDVLLHPSQSAEPFGLSIREAIVRDVWVIVSDAGGAADDTRSGENGIVIPFNNDPEDLKTAIKDTIKAFSVGKHLRMGGNEVRDWDAQCKELIEIYTELLH